MSRFLCVDIGAGTMDVLWFDTEAVHHYKAVVVSPVRTIAERAAHFFELWVRDEWGRQGLRVLRADRTVGGACDPVAAFGAAQAAFDEVMMSRSERR